MHDGFLKSILQVKKAVSINFECVWTYIHINTHPTNKKKQW